MIETNLLTCPFCGGIAETQVYGATGAWTVKCPCGSEINRIVYTESEAVEAWNTRAERTCRIVKEKRTLRSMLHGECEVVDEKCSECGGYMDVGCGVKRNYCPNCGAKIEGERN